jgi:FkbM family methyltransferase
MAPHFALKAAKVAQGLSYPLGRSALLKGLGATLEHDRILAEPWRTIIDVGANRGQFILAALHARPDITVHAFEPLPETVASTAAFFRAYPNVTVHPCAIGPMSGLAQIHVTAEDDSSSLLPVGEAQRDIFGSEEVATRRVVVRRLDEVLRPGQIEPPALLKLDVQGYELEALKGCDALLGCFSAIYAECSLTELYVGQALFSEVSAWLYERGFGLADIGPVQRHHGRAVQGDFLFRAQQTWTPASRWRKAAANGQALRA